MAQQGAFNTIQPSYDIPGIKVNQSIPDFFWKNFGLNGENMWEQLSPITKMVTLTAAQIRTNSKLISTGGESNRIPSGSVAMLKAATPTISIQTNQEYSKNTLMVYSEMYGVNYTDLMSAVARQSINQVMSVLALVGSGGTYEGLFNAPGKITTSNLLISDSFGATELGSQDPSEVRDAWVSLISDQLSSLNILATPENKVDVVVSISQRTMRILSSKVITMLNNGTGLAFSVIDSVKQIMALQNANVEWAVSSPQTQGKGASGSKYDRALITLPSLPKNRGVKFDTNYVADNVQQIVNENNLMLMSNMIPVEIPTPIENNGLRMLYEIPAITNGWNNQSNTVQVIADIKIEA
jgi:hypothetical protein